jgi:integrase
MRMGETELARFHTWLLEDGRQEGTADLYVGNLRMCAADAGGLTARLTAGELAPNTLRTNLAALRAWATWTDDGTLLVRLKRIRLPAVRRVKVKVPFPIEEWKALVREIRADKRMHATERAALEIVAVRGLRLVDAVKLERKALIEAQKTGRLSYEAKGRRRLQCDAGPIRGPIGDLLDCGRDWTRVEDLLTTRSKSKGFLRRRVATQRLYRALKRIARRIKIDGAHPHRLRRTYATEYLLRMAGDPQALIKLQNHMGWANADTALEYVDAVRRDELDQRGKDMVDELFNP